jgi:putative transposase
MTLYKNAYRVETARLRDWDYRSPGWYFVTICTNAHRCTLGEISDGKIDLSAAGQIAKAELVRMPTHYANVCLDAYVIMPNHVHAIVILEDHHQFIPDAMPRNDHERGSAPFVARLPSLSDVVGSYKAGVTRQCRVSGDHYFAWQPRFHDHILRGKASVAAVRDYIQNNPANWTKDAENPATISRIPP